MKKNQDNLFALNYARLFIKFALEEKLDFKVLLKNIEYFFKTFEKQEKRFTTLVKNVKLSINIKDASKIDKIMLSILLKKKVYLQHKIIYFFTKLCNEYSYLKIFKIISAKELTLQEKEHIHKTFNITEQDLIFYQQDPAIIGGFIIENLNNVSDFSTLKNLNSIMMFLKKPISY